MAGYDPAIDFVLVNSADQPIGFCICWQQGKEAHIEPLGIHPDYQSQGLGRALERAVAHQLQQQGVEQLHIDHQSFNETAVAVSSQNGFKRTNRALRYYVEIDPTQSS